MFKVSTADELLGSFRSMERDQVHIPSNLKFPLPVKNYLSWIEPSGHRAYLVFEDPENQKLLGVVFRRTAPNLDYGPVMCDWCRSVRGRGMVTMMTATVSRDRQVGVYLCSDLNCDEELRKPPGVNDLRESLDIGERTFGLMDKMHNFAKKNLF